MEYGRQMTLSQVTCKHWEHGPRRRYTITDRKKTKGKKVLSEYLRIPSVVPSIHNVPTERLAEMRTPPKPEARCNLYMDNFVGRKHDNSAENVRTG